MPFTYNFPFFCIFLPMVSAVIISVIRKPKVAWYICFSMTLVVALLSAIFLIDISHADVSFVYTMGKFPAPYGNEIKAGPLQGIFAVCFSVVMALSLLIGKKDMFLDVEKSRIGLACVMFSMVLASLMAMTYTNDAFTAYVFTEISTISACALVVTKEDGHTLLATIRYLFLSLLGSGLILLSLAILYGITGHLLMEQLTETISRLFTSGRYNIPLAASMAAMTAGLGIKSAMFPFHRWLPGAHGSATTSSSAVLSGLVLKGYVVLMITFFVRVFTLNVVEGLGVNTIVLLLGLCGMIGGSVSAIRETHIKRMLAYSSIAQVGYIFLGIGMCSYAGVAAACYQVLAHAFAKPLLFGCVGRLSAVSGHKKQLGELHGSAWKDPLAGIGFGIGALSMVGIPLLAGFNSKLFLAGASVGSWEAILVLSALALSSVLNALYYIPALLAIWDRPQRREKCQAKDRAFCVSACLLIVGVIALGIFFKPVMSVIVSGLQLM